MTAEDTIKWLTQQAIPYEEEVAKADNAIRRLERIRHASKSEIKTADEEKWISYRNRMVAEIRKIEKHINQQRRFK